MLQTFEENSEWQLWSNLFMDHARYLYALITHKSLKAKALKFLNIWKQLKNNVHEVITELEMFQTFLLEIILAKDTGEEIGCIFRSFIVHMYTEGEFFLQTIITLPSEYMKNKPDMYKTEIAFWSHHYACTLMMTAHLLDPEEIKYIADAVTCADKFKKLEETAHSLKTSEDIIHLIFISIHLVGECETNAQELANNVMDGHVSSLMSCNLFSDVLDHEHRENLYGRDRLIQLNYYLNPHGVDINMNMEIIQKSYMDMKRL